MHPHALPPCGARPQYNATLMVDEFGQGGITWAVGRLLPDPFGQRNTTTSRLSWRDTEAGLALVAERLIGVMKVRGAGA